MPNKDLKKSKNNALVKKRNWAFVCYPESVPDDWLEILRKTGSPIAISPLHDQDLNADGEEKKPHWHVIITFAGPTSKSVVKKITEALNAPPPQTLENVKGYYRYLTHDDNPEKFQYKKNEIMHLNGFSILDFAELSKSEENRIRREIHQIIINECIFEYAELIIKLSTEREELEDYASRHTIHFNTFVTSLRNKYERKQDGRA